MEMQKLALGILLLGASMSVAQAQTEAGKLLLNGRINYSNSKGKSSSTGSTAYSVDMNDERKDYSVGFSPQIGYFIADNVAVGVALGFSTGKSKTLHTEYNSNTGSAISLKLKQTNRNINVGPFVRYYKMISEKTGFYGQLAGGYQRQIQKSDGQYLGVDNRDYDYQTQTTGGYGSLLPGFVFFPTKKLGLDLTIGELSYFNNKTKSRDIAVDQGKSEANNSGFAGNFGIQYLTVGASLHVGN